MPHELLRKSKALRYHIFAAMPMVIMAETAAVNGIGLYDYKRGRLHRLVKRSLAGIDNPEYIAEKAGAPQDMEGVKTPTNLAWIEVYFQRFPDKERSRIKTLQDELRPFFLARIGGDMTALFSN